MDKEKVSHLQQDSEELLGVSWAVTVARILPINTQPIKVVLPQKLMTDWMKVWWFSAVATVSENLESASHYYLSGSEGLRHGLSHMQSSPMEYLGPGDGGHGAQEEAIVI